MEKPKRKPLADLYKAMKDLHKRPLNPAALKELNELTKKDAELENRKKDPDRRKIAKDPEVGV